MTEEQSKFREIRNRIEAAEHSFGRPPGAVSLLAVSKKKHTDQILTLRAGGQRAFGENYLQEAIPKIESLAGHAIEWHFIGRLQANKTRSIATHFEWIHTVDRPKLATRLNDQRPADAPPINVCIQVNISNEPQKGGVTAAAVPELIAAISECPRLRLRGLMALPTPEDDFERQRIPYRRLRETFERYRVAGMDTLSAGTSDDFEAAIAEGSTMVRIGSAIFGPRH